jgi:hypothetical protein
MLQNQSFTTFENFRSPAAAPMTGDCHCTLPLPHTGQIPGKKARPKLTTCRQSAQKK